MRIELSNEIEASPEQVWPVIADVERWPEWTQSISSAELLSGGKLGPLTSFRIRQPKFPAAVWHVTEFQPGRSFIWQNKSPGMTSTAGHTVDAVGQGRSKVTLWIEQTGLLAPLIAALWSKRSREYVAMELAGLKRRCEESAGT